MKTIKFFCLVGLILSFQVLNAQDANQVIFEKYLAEVYNSYLNNGWQGMKKYYTENASEVDPQGNLTSGFAALEKNYAMLESMIEGKPKFTYNLTSYNMVRPDVAVIYWDATDEVVLKGGQAAKFASTCSAVLVKTHSHWKIESTQLTPKVSFSNPGEDQAALMKLGQEGYAAFEARDAKRFASIYAEDAVFISPDGAIAYGREAIEKMHIELFKEWANSKKVSSDITNNTFRILSSDVVLINWIDKSVYSINGNTVTESLAFSNTCVKKEGKWQSAAFSMTPITKKEQPVK